MILNIIGLLLTIFALVLAVWQTLIALNQMKEARSQSEQAVSQVSIMKDQTESLLSIKSSLSTTYIGGFPNYITEVADLFDKTTSEMIVLCTLPIHAVYSKPESWLKLRHAVEAAASKPRYINIRCVFGDAESRSELLKFQFRDAFESDVSWQSWRESSCESSKVEDFVQRFNNNENSVSLSVDAFKSLFEIASHEALSSTFVGKNVKVGLIHARMSLYLWISDNREAIFSIVSMSPIFKSQAFRTVDQGLISAFRFMYDEFEELSTPC